MNYGIVVSYMVAGFLIIIIVTVGYNINYSGNELSLQENQKVKTAEVIGTITYDIPKIGYNLNALPDTLLFTADSNKIQFFSNIDNSADESLEFITWEFTTDSVTGTENPNDFILKRTVDGVTTAMSAGIVRFRINYYDELGSTTPLSVPITAASNKAIIDSIVQIEIILESESSIGLQYLGQSNSRYLASSWTKRFSPSNLSVN